MDRINVSETMSQRARLSHDSLEENPAFCFGLIWMFLTKHSCAALMETNIYWFHWDFCLPQEHETGILLWSHPLSWCNHCRVFVYWWVFLGFFLFFFPKVLNSFVIRSPENSIWLISDFWPVSRCYQGTLSRDHFTLPQLFPLLQLFLVSSSHHRGSCSLLLGK